MSISFPKRIYLLKSEGNRVCGFRRQDSSYIIGFVKRSLLDEAAQLITPESNMFMRDLTLTNARQHMETMYANEMKDVPDMKILLDTHAKLIVQKRGSPKSGAISQIDMVDTEELMMYPFTKNIGVVFANELVRQTQKQLVYDIHVIAPSFSTDLFEF